MTDPAHDLLAELGWLRALARRLARDPELADDLVQDACAVALAQANAPRSWRAWLATILPNLLHGHRRREAARVRREGAGGGRGPADDASVLLQRAEAQQKLVAAVLALAEPYRSTVLLRFFEGLPPRRIAARLAVPVATVHSRLQRALDQLRSTLDRDFAGRPNWLSVFAPFAWPTLAPTPFGVLVMQTKLKVLAAAAALACSAPLWWPSSASTTEPALAAANAADSRHRGGSSGGGADAAPAAPREFARHDATPTAATPPPSPRQFAVQGRVCDCRGTALADVPIGVDGKPDVAARSDANGQFTFEQPAEAARLAAVGERFVTVLSGTWTAAATIPPVVVVADAVRIGGRVVDEAGAPVPSCEIVLQLPADFDTRFPMPLDRAGHERSLLRCDGTGTFAPRRLPRIDGATLLASAEAFAPTSVPLPAADDENVQIVLRRFHFAGGELRGRVVDAGGAPAAGARVAMGVTSVVSAADGSFALGLRRAGWPTAIVAAKAGHRPARLEIPRQGGTRPEDWPSPLLLRLGPAPQSARGRVVDQDRRGIAKAEVWIVDPTPFGIAGLLPMQLEYLVAGGEVPPQAARMKVPHADEPTTDGNFTTQASRAPMPTACWFYATTDESGAFELPGLLDRSYTLRALDVTTGLFGEASDVFGGSFQEIAIRREVWPELRGKVVSIRGDGIAGVRIEQGLVAFRHEARVPGGRFEGTALREGASATTGPDGSFVLHDVGKQHCVFTLSGDAVLPGSVQAEDIGNPLHFLFQAQARCHVEVVLQDPLEADEVACFDGNDRQLDLAVLRRNSNSFETELPLHAGRSGLFVVGERAAKLVLLRAGQRVRVIPFTPDPKRTTTLQ